jgi:hypothetical protein
LNREALEGARPSATNPMTADVVRKTIDGTFGRITGSTRWSKLTAILLPAMACRMSPTNSSSLHGHSGNFWRIASTAIDVETMSSARI